MYVYVERSLQYALLKKSMRCIYGLRNQCRKQFFYVSFEIMAAGASCGSFQFTQRMHYISRTFYNGIAHVIKENCMKILRSTTSLYLTLE